MVVKQAPLEMKDLARQTQERIWTNGDKKGRSGVWKGGLVDGSNRVGVIWSAANKVRQAARQ